MSFHPPSRRSTGWRSTGAAVVLVASILAAMAFGPPVAAGSSHRAAAPTGSWSGRRAGGHVATALPRATPPYRVVGNEVIGANHVRLVPYGFVVDCMALKSPPVSALCTGNSGQDPWNATAMLNAARRYWHADVIRFQVADPYLFSGGGINAGYLHLVDRLVDQATSLHMASIVTLQTERFNEPVFPTEMAVRFWKFMAKHFRSNPNVLFDLFNEPRLRESVAGGPDNLWRIWRNGGTAAGVHYVGDQALVKAIRGEHAHNVIIAESNDFDRVLNLLPEYYLNGKNIAYGVEPNLSPAHDTKPEWVHAFGRFTVNVPIFPEAFLPRFQECNATAPTILPQLFKYLNSIHMGLIVWTLLPGVTTVGTDLRNPTTFARSRRSTDPCFHGGKHAVPSTTYGEGAAIRKYYAANSPG